ncbi:RDD family protein [Sulfurimonas microaerophilic]|uniref:RDD family protein n=1 Tax=Sulfurimonas microaerophilic TaxID=3058392 RepID=UPI00271482AC|nr:RDD family protein [Sulfurimonas sp. hsl 1-7]
MSEVKYAGFGIRFLASLLDTFFLALPVGIVIYFISGGEWFDFSQYQQNLQMAMAGNANALNSQPQTSFTWELIFELSVLIVTIIFWKQFKGATPGKKIVNIKIVDAKTLKDISNKQAITRSLGYIPSTLLFGLGFLMIIFTKNKQSLHDMLANTVVIYTLD